MHLNSRIFILPGLVSFSLWVFPARAQDSTTTLTFQNCLAIAGSNATEILEDRNSVVSAGAQALEAYGQFLPNLTGEGDYGYMTGNQYLSQAEPTLVQTRRTFLDYQLVSSLNIFSGFSNYASLKAAVLGRQSADLTLDRARQDIDLDITQSFLQVILDRQVVLFTAKNFNTSTHRGQELESLTGVGRNPIADLYQQQAQTSNDQYLYISSRTKLRNDALLLERKLKLDLSKTYDFEGPDLDVMSVDTPEYNLEDLLDTALNDRPDLKAAKLEVDQSNWQIKKYQGAYWPQVSLEAGLYDDATYLYRQYVNGVSYLPGDQKSIIGQLPEQLYGAISLNLRWNIFTGYYNRMNVVLAQSAASNTVIGFQDLRLEILADIRQAYGDYQDALQQLGAAQQGLIAAQKSYDAQNGRYQVGATDFITLISAQTALLQAEVNKAQALVAVVLEQKTIDYYVGK